MKTNMETIANYYDRNDDFCDIVYNHQNERAYKINYIAVTITPLPDYEALYGIVCELMEAVALVYVNPEHIEPIKNELFSITWCEDEEKKQAWDLLVNLKEMEG